MSSSAISTFYHNNMRMGIDATGDDKKEQWKDGNVFTFWTYNYSFPGTKEYHVYHTQNNYNGVMNETQRFTLSNFKLKQENENEGWNLTTSFWAFENERVKKFMGKILIPKT